MKTTSRCLLITIGVLAGVATSADSAGSVSLGPTLDFRLGRADLKCLVDTSGSLLEHSEPIAFAPELCVGPNTLDALLNGSQRTSLPNWKMSLPDRRPRGAAAGPRYVFTRKTLQCLVDRAKAGAYAAGDPVHVDLRDCR